MIAREYGNFIVGGAGVATTNLVKYLRLLGAEVHVLSFGDPSYNNDLDHYIDPKSSILLESKQKTRISSDTLILYDILHITKEAKNLAKKYECDIIHVQEPYIGGLITHNRGKVTTIHDTSYEEIMSLKNSGLIESQSLKKLVFYSSLGFTMEHFSISTSHVVITPSYTVREKVLKVYKASPRKVLTIHNGVEVPDKINYSKYEARRYLRLPEDRLIIFTTMRHIPRKKLDLLIEATHKILQNYKSLRKDLLVIIGGEGPLTLHLKEMVNSYGLESAIVFPGWIPQSKLCLYYLSSDIYVFPSISESAPLSLLEACAYALPIVTTKVGDYAIQMRNGYDALVIPPNNVDALIKALLLLIQDEELRRQLSKNAREFAKLFSWKEIAQEHLRTYNTIISR